MAAHRLRAHTMVQEQEHIDSTSSRAIQVGLRGQHDAALDLLHQVNHNIWPTSGKAHDRISGAGMWLVALW